MRNRKVRQISPYADRMGRFIGQIRDHEGITLKQLSRGLCEQSYLNKIENGEREAGKLMTDAFFQRLGKPAELFGRILEHEEFVKWTRRQEIISYLRSGNTAKARECAESYQTEEDCVLDRQFLAIIEIDCHALEGMPARELLPLVTNALRLTQPDFGAVPFDTLLLSQNEGRLLFAHLQLREELEGGAAMAEEYRALMRYFKHPRYESRERVYLYPYVACRVVEHDYREGNYPSALAVCEDALSELTLEKRLFAYDRLLAWKQTLFDAMGNPDHTPGHLRKELKKMLARAPECVQLLVPCEEQGYVYCLNQVIRDRRALLGFSQEELSDKACGLRSISRIENEDRKLQRKNRKLILQKVNMSGERYDYEIISERYEDYLLRSELDRAINSRNLDEAGRLFAVLKERVPNLPTNQQYLLKQETVIRSLYPEDHPDKVSISQQMELLEDAIHLTLPLDLGKIDLWPVSVLTVNETLSLMLYGVLYKKQGKNRESLSVLQYVRKCLENTDADIAYYEDLYSRLGLMIPGVLNGMKKYRQAELYSLECMYLSIRNQNSCRLARFAYTAACNIEAQLHDLPTDLRAQKESEMFALLRTAMVVTEILNDKRGKRHIEEQYRKLSEKYVNSDWCQYPRPKAHT